MMPTEQELKEMGLDMINMDRDRVKEICMEIMRDELSDYQAVCEELELLKSGRVVILPTSTEQAEAMFKVASNYLGYWSPGKAFDFK